MNHVLARSVEPRPPVAPTELPPLEPGDRLDQPTFHARYEAMPQGTRAELIGGIVHMPSPLKLPHSRKHTRLLRWLMTYEEASPGTEAHDNATVILGNEREPQPDGLLFILPENGGRIREVDEYIAGAPEFVAEVALSTEAIDLHGKKADYETAGVQEYLVINLRQARVFWFILRNGKFEDLQPGLDGIIRSEVFPGLWLDPAAFLQGDYQRVTEVLRQGLASPEHNAFVAKLTSQSAR